MLAGPHKDSKQKHTITVKRNQQGPIFSHNGLSVKDARSITDLHTTLSVHVKKNRTIGPSVKRAVVTNELRKLLTFETSNIVNSGDRL